MRIQSQHPTMPTTIEKEWAAVDGDRILLKANTKQELEQKIIDEDVGSRDYEIVALPKGPSSMFI